MADENKPRSSLTPSKDWFGISSPFGMFGAFAALVEISLLGALIFKDGSVQWGMIALATLVFLCTFGAFVFFLWHQPGVLYAPRDFGGETGVSAYIRATMLYRKNKISSDETKEMFQELKKAIAQAVTSPDSTQTLMQAVPDQIEGRNRDEIENALVLALDSAVEKAVEQVKDTNFVTLRIDDIRGEETRPLNLYYDPDGNITSFLIYVADVIVTTDLDITLFSGDVTDAVRQNLVESYGDFWVLRDRCSGRLFDDVGPSWSKRTGKLLSDRRSLSEVGLHAGMELEAIRRPKKGP